MSYSSVSTISLYTTPLLCTEADTTDQGTPSPHNHHAFRVYHSIGDGPKKKDCIRLSSDHGI